MRQVVKDASKQTMPFNTRLAMSELYSLRNNRVPPLMDPLENRILKEGPIRVDWKDGMQRMMTRVERKTIGDLYLPGGNSVPELIARTGSAAWQLYNPNYSPSFGELQAREAVRYYYKKHYWADIPVSRILLRDGVTGIMPIPALLFASPKNAPGESSTYMCGSIGYAPWPGVMIQMGVDPIFVPVNERHEPVIRAEGIPRSVQFILAYSVGNPGGMATSQAGAENLFAETKRASEMQGRPIMIMLDDSYNDPLRFHAPEKEVNYLALAEKHGVPLMMISGFDKVVGTGAHGAWALFYIPPEYEQLGKDIDRELARINGVYLGANEVTQLQIMAYNLARAGLKPHEIEQWALSMPSNAPTRRGTDDEFHKAFRKHVSDGWFETALTMEEEIRRDLKKSWENTNTVLKVFKRNDKYVKMPKGGLDIPYYLFPEIPNLRMTSEDFAVDLFMHTGIGVLPGDPFIGEPFRKDGKLQVRFAIVGDPMMNSLLNPDEKVSFAEEVVNFIKVRMGQQKQN